MFSSFKLCFGKQTQALVRKTAKLQPIPPTPGFNSHCSVIAPKDTDDIEVQYDQSQVITRLEQKIRIIIFIASF